MANEQKNYLLQKISGPYVKSSNKITKTFIQKQIDYSYIPRSTVPYEISIYRRYIRPYNVIESWFVLVRHKHWQPINDYSGPVYNIFNAKQWLRNRFIRSHLFLSKEDIDAMFNDLLFDKDFINFKTSNFIPSPRYRYEAPVSELSSLYKELSTIYDAGIGDRDSIYLMDGCYLTPDGNIIKK